MIFQKPLLSEEEKQIDHEKRDLLGRIKQLRIALEEIEYSTQLEKIIPLEELSQRLRDKLQDLYEDFFKLSQSLPSTFSQEEFQTLGDHLRQLGRTTNHFFDLIAEAHRDCEALEKKIQRISTPMDHYHRRKILWIISISTVSLLILGTLYSALFLKPPTPFEQRMAYLERFESSKKKSPRLSDLVEITKALELYHKDHLRYPISKDSKWSSAKTVDPTQEREWIEGLVPKYLPYVPTDPEASSRLFRQYIYKSNGTDYKILVNETDEVHMVKYHFPDLVDPKRENDSFGFWSSGALHW